MAAHPSETAGPALQRSWDARAWAEGRPDKVTPRPGADLDGRWRTELAALGYRDRERPVALTPAPVGALDRDGAVERVLGRLAAARSAWNAADVRGEVEQLIAAHGIVADGGVRAELAEDLTARTVESCVRLRDSDGVPVVAPEHVRALTSQPVLDVEADLTGRLAARSAVPARNVSEQLRLAEVVTRGMTGLDAGQATAAVALAGDWSLLVVEGAAGAGKTTTLAAARQAGGGVRLPAGDRHPDAEGGQGRDGRGRRAGGVGGVAGLTARLAVEQRGQLDPTRRRTGRPGHRPELHRPVGECPLVAR
jgi:hypothetical protein